MKTKYLYIAQFLAWMGFTAIDYIENKTSYYIDKVISINLKDVICFGIPIILGILYFIKKKSLWSSEKRRPIKKQIKRLARLIGIWVLVTVISTITLSALVCNDVWIVPQYGFDVFYYPALGYLLLFVPTGIILIGELLILIAVKCSSYWKSRKD
ncbi:MAG: hypothetical protein HDR25_01520 [Lachnospiraceae bacterium]|nr:hypothetical protein [Lachnospiraceae bacterium]